MQLAANNHSFLGFLKKTKRRIKIDSQANLKILLITLNVHIRFLGRQTLQKRPHKKDFEKVVASILQEIRWTSKFWMPIILRRTVFEKSAEKNISFDLSLRGGKSKRSKKSTREQPWRQFPPIFNDSSS